MVVQRMYDVIIVGLGAYGSAAAFHLARAGASVLGLERQPSPVHSMGSSHGHTRITRMAYREGPEYYPLLRRSLDLFTKLQQETGQQLYVPTGILEVGPTTATGPAVASARLLGLEHQVLSGAQVMSRFPAYRLPLHWQAMHQASAGVLVPEACVQAQCDGATASGADLRFGQRVAGWEGAAPGGGVEVRLESGERVAGRSLLMAAGSWMPALVPELKALLTPVRQVVAWFGIHPASRPHFQPDRFPVFLLDTEEEAVSLPAGTSQYCGTAETSSPGQSQGLDPVTTCTASGAFYGFPEFGPQPGFKFGLYNHLNQVVDPDTMDRGVSAEDEAVLRAGVRAFFPSADGAIQSATTCLFTNTQDGHFLVDRHPLYPNVMLCSACSGHGFKMSSGVGQLLAAELMAGLGKGGPAQGLPGMEATEKELALHRIQPASRPGHAAFLKACQDAGWSSECVSLGM